VRVSQPTHLARRGTERSTNLERIFYTHFTLGRFSNNLLLSTSVSLNVISSVRHPSSSASSETAQTVQTIQTDFFVYYFFDVIDVVFRSRRCRGKEKEKLWTPSSVYIRGNIWQPNTMVVLNPQPSTTHLGPSLGPSLGTMDRGLSTKVLSCFTI
jgi:hypothetical protein